MKLSDLYIKLGLKKDGFDKGIDGAKKKTNSFSSSIKKIGGFIAGAFAAERVLAFGKELLELGGIAEGVEAAFKRIGGGRYLADLKEATKGTVSELELMKRAVMASNFQIPIENLADLFKFATKRAQETGESVDYLVNSIVLGIGRKSPLILDNLGISAVRLRQELKGAGVELNTVQDIAAAVGRIAASEMEKSGDIIETNAIKLQSLTASWENFKKTLATDKSVQTFMSRLIIEAQDFINLTTKFQTTKQVEEEQKARDEANKKREEQIKMQTELFNLFGKSVNNATQVELDAATKAAAAQWEAIKAEKERGKTIAEIKEETKALKETLDSYGVNQKEEIQNTLKQIDANEKLIDNLLNVGGATKDLSNITHEASASIIKSYLDIKNNAPTVDEIFNLTAPEIDTGGIANFADSLFGDEVLDELPIDTKKIVAQLMAVDEIIKSFGGAIASSFQSIGVAIGEALAGGSWDNFGKALLDVIGKFMQILGGAIIGIGVGLLQLETGLASLNPALIIAGGVALVAGGAALSSIAGGGLKGTASSMGASGYSPSSSSASTAISGDVNFVLEGDKLVGAINNNSAKRRLTR